VVRLKAKPVKKLLENHGDALARRRRWVVGMPELDFLEEQFQEDRLAAGRRGKALLDSRPLVITDLAARLGKPPVENQQASFGLRESVQVDEVPGRDWAAQEFGVRLSGGITGGSVGQAGDNELHMGRQRARRQPVQQPAIVGIRKLVEGVQKQDQRLLWRG